MAKYFTEARSIQLRLSSLMKRIDQVQQNAASQKWPHANLKSTVRLYVHNIAESARQSVLAAADRALIPVSLLHAPVNEFYDRRLLRRFTDIAKQRDMTVVEESAQAIFACCETDIKVAANLVSHLESCVLGEQSIHGQPIARGRLWDK